MKDSAESHSGLYWCNDYKRCGTLCFDLLATLQCNCTHIWKVHIGHSLLSISLQLNGWLCLAVKKWAILTTLASCLIVPNLYFIKMMTHCTSSPLLTPVLLISNSLGSTGITQWRERIWGHPAMNQSRCVTEQFHPHDCCAQQMDSKYCLWMFSHDILYVL